MTEVYYVDRFEDVVKNSYIYEFSIKIGIEETYLTDLYFTLRLNGYCDDDLKNLMTANDGVENKLYMPSYSNFFLSSHTNNAKRVTYHTLSSMFAEVCELGLPTKTSSYLRKHSPTTYFSKFKIRKTELYTMIKNVPVYMWYRQSLIYRVGLGEYILL